MWDTLEEGVMICGICSGAKDLIIGIEECCGHVFHEHCYKYWLIQQKYHDFLSKCPICSDSEDLLDIGFDELLMNLEYSIFTDSVIFPTENILNLLLHRGWNINSPCFNNGTSTILTLAISNGRLDLVGLLKNFGAEEETK